ncbi:DNA gyrase subunit A [Candidatus Palauibacter sp.]|uniref:DNA gyrase subunit A n=1 Tax=Candidatus Palauibacter sp. TaxID=3101350 RepID=UPI003B5CF8A0
MTHGTLQHERIEPRALEQEMRESFIDYSMSVIVQRALPDARDGLKPVHRRILYAMLEEGLHPSRPHKKSATVVGNVLGRYHPHGDSAVYDTMVRMVQDFSLRYPLIDGQGNFGSIDGDSAAAYRYTEVRMTPVAIDLLEDIDRDTVNMRPNFDGRLKEPEVLPCRLPHLLLNGSDGIAVGMATKIPPHNAVELLGAVDHLVANPQCDVDELLDRVPGPDFPTGGYIRGRAGIESAYRTGRGRLDMRARIHLEEGRFGKSSLIVTELPYQVNKTRVIEQITRLVRAGRTDAITDLRDESDRDGIRLVIELKRDAKPEKVVATLFKKTQLRYTFGVIMLALVDGKPEELDLRAVLGTWIDHRLSVIRRGAAHDLTRAKDRAHVVEGLQTSLDEIDRVIEIIRGSRTPGSARESLLAEFELTGRQADAILAMRLVQLTGLEREKLAEELLALNRKIVRLTALVEDDVTRRAFLRADLQELATRYDDPRRTEILDDDAKFRLSVGSGGETKLVLVSRGGYVKAQPAATGGGLAGAEVLSSREGDFARYAFLARGSAVLLAVTARGHAHAVPVNALPRGTRSSRGRPIEEFIDSELGDEIVALLPIEAFARDRFLVVATRQGQVKRSALSEYVNARAAGIIGARIARGDEVVAAFLTEGGSDVLLATRSGQSIRFSESEIRVMGRTAGGVRAIDLAHGDVVVAAAAPRADADLLVATSAGYGKRIPFTEFRVQGRAGKGLTVLPEKERTGGLVGFIEAHDADEVAWELSDGSVEATSAAAVLRRAPREAGRPVVHLRPGVAVEAVHPMHSGRRTQTTPPSADERRPLPSPELSSEEGDSQAEFEF